MNIKSIPKLNINTKEHFSQCLMKIRIYFYRSYYLKNKRGNKREQIKESENNKS